MRNPDTSRPNRNTLYIARSGAGKSQCLLQNPAIPAKGARVVLWDTNNDHKARHFGSMAAFIRALDKANKENWRTGAGFRVAYDGVDTMEAYDLFCQAAMAVLDGRKETIIVVEELSAVCTHAGKARPAPAKLLNQCRKYGGIFHGTTQKPTEISKTYYSQCELRYVGMQKTLNEQKRMAEELGVTVEQIQQLEPLQFLYDDGRNKPELVQFNYKKPV